MTEAAGCRADEVVVNVLDRVDEVAWNRRLLTRSEGTWRQSTYYGEYKRRRWFEEPAYLLARDGEGKILGQLLALFTHPYGWSLFRRGALPAARICSKISPSFYWLEGPVVFEASRSRQICEGLVQKLVSLAGSRGCVIGTGHPPYHGFTEEESGGSDPVYAEIGFLADRRATLLLDLNADIDYLWKGLKREARNKVRTAEKQGVEIIEVDNGAEGLERLHAVMSQTSKRNRVSTLSLDNLRISSWSENYRHGLSKAFVSVHNGELVSSQMATIFNGIITLGGVSYTDYSRQNRIYGNDLMQWHMIKWGKEMGHSALDFCGVAPASSSEKAQAIYAFKRKWGGREVEYNAYRMKFSSLRGRLYHWATESLAPQIKSLDRRMKRSGG